MGRLLCLSFALSLVVSAGVRAYAQEGHPDNPQSPAEAPPMMDHANMDMGQAEHGMHHEHSLGGAMFGRYGMSREASGTSWQPESSLMEGVHVMRGDWTLMLHGFGDIVYDHQGGLRGDEKVYGPTMGMLMAQRPLGAGTFGIRTMLSLDPAAVGKAGYPLLLQTGEAINGTPLIDRQHPHDLFMELAVSYSHPLAGDRGSVFAYAALPGEPALGPPTFMHRFSGIEIPEAPITHHWLDSTHITFGVLTGGVTSGDVKIDASAFRGREPDQHRWNIETPRLDSYSTRLQYNPTSAWSFQASVGHLHSPEELEPDVNLWRTTASAMHNRTMRDGAWQTTLAWGRNDRTDQSAQDAFLLESSLRTGHHTFLARGERVRKDELFLDEPLARSLYDVSRLSVGYLFDVVGGRHAVLGFGGVVSFIGIPASLRTSYGGQPTSFMLFSRARVR